MHRQSKGMVALTKAGRINMDLDGIVSDPNDLIIEKRDETWIGQNELKQKYNMYSSCMGSKFIYLGIILTNLRNIGFTMQQNRILKRVQSMKVME